MGNSIFVEPFSESAVYSHETCILTVQLLGVWGLLVYGLHRWSSVSKILARTLICELSGLKIIISLGVLSSPLPSSSSSPYPTYLGLAKWVLIFYSNTCYANILLFLILVHKLRSLYSYTHTIPLREKGIS